MAIEIRQVGPEAIDQHYRIPIRFQVESVFEIAEDDGGQFTLTERPLPESYTKDYDECPDGEESSYNWTKRFDSSNSLFLQAFDEQLSVGGAIVVVRTAGIDMLEGRDDLAVLWDLRVHPDCRRQGIARQFFDRAVTWARAQGLRQLKIETQDINVPACRFYASRGCYLKAIDRDAYADCATATDETEMLWYLDL